VLELEGVTKRYRMADRTVVALDDVDFSVERGEFVTIMGPSGSGKSTMLNVLDLLDDPTEGTVYLNGEDVTDLSDEEKTRARLRFLGFVFQNFFLISSLTAKENVELPAAYARDPDAGPRARDLLERMGLGERLHHRPNELSGGQRQRVAIARALVNEPAVVLADEPTGNLDRETGREILTQLAEVCDRGVSVVVVTHDPLVGEFTDRTVNITDGRLEP